MYLLFPFHFTCVWFFPWGEVEVGDERVWTDQHVLRPLDAWERVSGDVSDVAIVTNDAGQRDITEVFPLGAGEHAFPLPPKPQETKTQLDFSSLHHNGHNFTSGFSYTCPRLWELWTVSPAGRTGAVPLDLRAERAQRWRPPTHQCCAVSRTGAEICEPKWSYSGYRPVQMWCWEQRGRRTFSTSRILMKRDDKKWHTERREH